MPKKEFKVGETFQCGLIKLKCIEYKDENRSCRITPAWSLDRLLEIMPKSITQSNRPNADFDMNSDGQYWFISYEELGYDVKHQEMRHKSFDAVICMIEWLIHNNHLNPEYLKEKP